MILDSISFSMLYGLVSDFSNEMKTIEILFHRLKRFQYALADEL
jgi:hypothetical protein